MTLQSCLADVFSALTGEPSAARPDVLADTSPAEILPGKAKQISVNGAKDRIAPPALGMAYSWRVVEAGGAAAYETVPGGHVELIAPDSAAFHRQVALIEEAFQRD